MKSRSISIQNKALARRGFASLEARAEGAAVPTSGRDLPLTGFTLLETLIVMALAGILAAGGIVVGIDSYQRYNFRAERDLVVSLLAKARSEAVNNIGAQTHGLYFGDPTNYVLFRGTSFVTATDKLSVPRSQSITITPPPLLEVVFTQLSGVTSAAAIHLSGVPGADITINAGGGINW